MNDDTQKPPTDKPADGSNDKQPKTTGAGLKWSLYIGLPFVCQIMSGMILHPNPLSVTRFDWFLMDNFNMRLSDAQSFTDIACRILGAVVGFAIAFFIVRSRAKSQKTN